MAEPASSTAVGVAIAAGTITLTGSIFGVQYDGLLAGFFGGLIALSFLGNMKPLKIASTVATSSLLAGFISPIAAAAGLNYFPWLASVGDFTRIAAAAVIGLGAQSVIPIGLNWLRVKGGVQ